MKLIHPTVLVLGAGASTHAGFPLGRELVRDVYRLTHGTNAYTTDETEEEANERQRIKGLLEQLNLSGLGSVDRFLETRSTDRELVRLGKRLMTLALWSKCDSSKLTIGGGEPGWYEVLYEFLFGREATPVDNLTIVSFNYERSLPYYLFQRLRFHHQLDVDAAREVLLSIPFIHVHGTFSQYGIRDGEPYILPICKEQSLVRKTRDSSITVAADRIHIVGELDDAQLPSEYTAATQAIESASRLYFLGFGFGEDNVRRLLPDEDLLRGTDCFTTFVGTVGDFRSATDTLEQCGIRPGDIFENGGMGHRDCRTVLYDLYPLH